MTKTLTMSALYRKLSQIGLKQSYVRENGLPSWWDDELNDKPVAVLEGAGYIAKNLNLDLSSLLTPEEDLKFNTFPNTKFKQHNSQNKEHPHLAQALASRVAELISLGVDLECTALPNNPQTIREDILSHYPTVNLTSLLDYCWGKGIAVGYFHHFPREAKKFAGLIQWHSTCPVIILSSKSKYSARLAFDLAHELGHLALEHLNDGVLVDENIKSSDNDEEESKANQFATELLLGDCDNCFGDKEFYRNDHLIKHAKLKAQENPTVDVTSIILNNAWHNNNWGLANNALKKLEPIPNGDKIINEYLANQLDWDKFNDETYEYLEKVLGV
ncbi:MAG: ImmA/IrrE family metallo-endopeptidase [Chloroflexaceae bacterium]|nr:ImmA/IrrE family metallo-endopeptidase [Chloroflexaceae bacterium]